jgi:hypothetical protein
MEKHCEVSSLKLVLGWFGSYTEEMRLEFPTDVYMTLYACYGRDGGGVTAFRVRIEL